MYTESVTLPLPLPARSLPGIERGIAWKAWGKRWLATRPPNWAWKDAPERMAAEAVQAMAQDFIREEGSEAPITLLRVLTGLALALPKETTHLNWVIPLRQGPGVAPRQVEMRLALTPSSPDTPLAQALPPSVERQHLGILGVLDGQRSVPAVDLETLFDGETQDGKEGEGVVPPEPLTLGHWDADAIHAALCAAQRHWPTRSPFLQAVAVVAGAVIWSRATVQGAGQTEMTLRGVSDRRYPRPPQDSTLTVTERAVPRLRLAASNPAWVRPPR
jgi:hypothetical protein